MAKVAKIPHKYAFWFAKPVCVQFKQPYLVCVDGGPVEVAGELNEEKVTLTYGSPNMAMTKDGPLALPSLSGVLTQDPQHPDRVVLEAKLNMGGLPNHSFMLSIEPELIAFITVIPEHQPATPVETPKGNLIVP